MKLLHGDCLDVLKELPDNSVDAVVTDPPYGLKFMNRHWDYDVPSVDVWRECLRVLKPGGHLLAFAGTRTQHRMVCNIEDAGFEVRDRIRFECSAATKYGALLDSLTPEQQGAVLELLNDQVGLGSEMAWVYGSGFSKSLDVSKAIDKAAGVEREVLGYTENARPNRVGKETKLSGAQTICGEITAPATEAARQWEGWGTALKPAHETICVARKPLIGTVAANVLAHGTGALNIAACRVPATDGANRARPPRSPNVILGGGKGTNLTASEHNAAGRWPANLIHDGSDEVLAGFPTTGPSKSGGKAGPIGYHAGGSGAARGGHDDNGGSAARFFYCAKASKRDRGEGNGHPTVKPTDLMRYLCRLVTPPGGVVLDPFMGSGSTGKAAKLEGFQFVGIEREAEYLEIAQARIIRGMD